MCALWSGQRAGACRQVMSAHGPSTECAHFQGCVSVCAALNICRFVTYNIWVSMWRICVSVTRCSKESIEYLCKHVSPVSTCVCQQWGICRTVYLWVVSRGDVMCAACCERQPCVHMWVSIRKPSTVHMCVSVLVCMHECGCRNSLLDVCVHVFQLWVCTFVSECTDGRVVCVFTCWIL